FYQYAATLTNDKEVTEDTFAYLRDGWDFKNCLLVEQPNGDWAQTILRQFLFSNYQFYFYQQLQNSTDSQLAAIAEKSLKEVTYHLRWSAEWVIRLGDGTEESNNRMLKAIDELWKYTGELFSSTSYELQVASDESGVDTSKLREAWMNKVKDVLSDVSMNDI